MKTIEMNGVNLILTEETAETIERELNREREERRSHWLMWNWHARRWAMYGNKFDCDGDYFSDMYKEETGMRPHMSRGDIFWMLYERECWVEHGPYNTRYHEGTTSHPRRWC